MKNLFFCLSLCFLYSCNCHKAKVNNGLHGGFPPNEKQAWIEAYKSEYFISCLGAAYGKSFDSLNAIDVSSSVNTEIIGSEISDRVDSIGFKIGKVRSFDEGDFAGKKSVVNNCLQYYNSKELDSLAENAYSIYKKKTN